MKILLYLAPTHVVAHPMPFTLYVMSLFFILNFLFIFSGSSNKEMLIKTAIMVAFNILMCANSNTEWVPLQLTVHFMVALGAGMVAKMMKLIIKIEKEKFRQIGTM